MHNKTLLFDFDGTIAATVEAGVAIFNELAGQNGFSEITAANSGDLRDKGPREAMKTLSIPTLKAPFVLRKLRMGIRKELANLKAVDSIKGALMTLKQRGYTLGIVTSNSEENVLEFLKRNDLDFFDHIQGGVGLFRKSYAIRKAMFLNRLDRSEVTFIGDEIRDVVAAHKSNIKVIAVTWGTNSRAGLAGANPDLIVDTPEELLEALP